MQLALTDLGPPIKLTVMRLIIYNKQITLIVFYYANSILT